MKATIRSDGLHHSLEVDGQDVSKACSSATIRLDAGAPARAEIETCLPVVETHAGEAEVIVSSQARELLILAGWTPPKE